MSEPIMMYAYTKKYLHDSSSRKVVQYLLGQEDNLTVHLFLKRFIEASSERYGETFRGIEPSRLIIISDTVSSIRSLNVLLVFDISFESNAEFNKLKLKAPEIAACIKYTTQDMLDINSKLGDHPVCTYKGLDVFVIDCARTNS